MLPHKVQSVRLGTGLTVGSPDGQAGKGRPCDLKDVKTRSDWARAQAPN